MNPDDDAPLETAAQPKAPPADSLPLPTAAQPKARPDDESVLLETAAQPAAHKPAGAAPGQTMGVPKADDFPEMLARVRAADPAAIRAWVAAYEPFIRRAVRSRMTGLRGQGAADSDDVCQSVLGSLLIRLAAGEYDLGTAADLEKLLFVMIRNKVAGLARREAVSQRSRVRLTDSGFVVAADSSEDPAQLVADRDLLTEVHARLTAADQLLLNYRREGRPWDEIAGLVGGSALVLRKRFSRALQQVAIDLGLEDDE